MFEHGYQDGLKNKADFAFLLGQPDENAYWRGFDYGKSKRPQRKVTIPIQKLKQTVPFNFRGVIRDSDLKAAYQMMIAGHALDGVRTIPPRDPDDAIEAMTTAMRELGGLYDGSIRLYRTIQVDNPNQWLRDHLSQTQRLGRYWSTSENYVMGHETHEMVLFCVDAPGSSIDWIETIVTTADGVEGEVRLREGKPVKLIYTEPAPNDFTPSPKQLA